ncbi:uncharacterized protein SCODWIG_03015 [Saccharomycodes ludwigii]|uniref:Cell wall mannoprotein PIR1-like C-terminal domain-containing protein n=1 Tax=Saccharomycodes ludwigii TaxID=36035 RepID=A0A376B9P9_9ASCO|nr:uncharacterized protein SCODWIG_03015 [Saccharomycodes ludwigii]
MVKSKLLLLPPLLLKLLLPLFLKSVTVKSKLLLLPPLLLNLLPLLASSLTTSFTSSITPTGSTTTLAPATTTASNSTDPVEAQACKTNGTLSMTLNDGILKDSKDRIGSIVANRQFQFDGPPQAGAIYAKGWSITQEGNLAIGTEDVFYQCLSGDFYNLYDERIGGQCKAVHLEVIDLVSC